MDINLGSGIDGTQAAEEILNHKDIPVVFLSSHTEPEIVEKTEKITSYGYVVKSSSIVVLDASIKMALKLFDVKNEHTLKEAALQESEKRFYELFERAPLGYQSLDSDGRIGHDADGSFKQTHCILKDGTGQKQAEDELRRNEKDLRESQRIAHVGSWRLDVATDQVVWTEELYNMYGFDPALPPPPYTEHMKLFTPESWEKLSTALAHTREKGIPYTLELETIKKDGNNGWMWVHGEADVDPAGKTVGLWGAAQDITERRQAEERQKSEKELLA